MLPVEFQPISVCLHMHDVNKGRHRVFLKNDVAVFTAGNSSDQRFIERFYDIIKNFKYVTSNQIGTVTFYSIEMGLQFFLYGELQKSINKEDKNFPLGTFNGVEYNNSSILAAELTIDKASTIPNSKVMEIINYELGLINGISRIKMTFVLWYSLVLWLFSLRFIEYLDRILKKIRLND